jgi:transcriptional regulator with AAA-type ATPase domain
MSNQDRLSPSEREFFSVASRAVFSNPFGEERADLDRQMGGGVGGESRREAAERGISRVIERVRELEARGRADLRHYAGETADAMRNVFLFEVYYRFGDEFTGLIRAQLKAGHVPVAAPFGREAVAVLVQRGFPEDFALRCFAIMYQMWRAFHFIQQQLVGISPSMRRLRFDLWNNVFTQNLEWYGLFVWERMEEYSTLLLGETGTGKGTAAAAIGQCGFIPFDAKRRRFEESFTRNFTAINLSQFPESLIESELFGHRKGSFTGAIEHHDGIFSRCNPHGSIFLDEIGDLSIPVQTKLLEVLQDRTFCQVGSHEKLRFRGRVIAATNKPLDEMRRDGQFRQDLYYRLCSNTITLPSLRQRFGENAREFDLMLAHAVTRMTGKERPAVVEAIREVLRRDVGDGYTWPGNVRELEQAVRSVLLIGAYKGETACGPAQTSSSLLSRIESGELSLEELASEYCALLYERYGSYEEVGRRARLDWRTVKKYVGGKRATEPNEPVRRAADLVRKALFRG